MLVLMDAPLNAAPWAHLHRLRDRARALVARAAHFKPAPVLPDERTALYRLPDIPLFGPGGPTALGTLRVATKKMPTHASVRREHANSVGVPLAVVYFQRAPQEFDRVRV
jgi:hypothetical protein